MNRRSLMGFSRCLFRAAAGGAAVLLLLALVACLAANAGDGKAPRSQSQAAGEIRNGMLFVQLRTASGADWPDGPIDIWLAQLTGAREATAVRAERRDGGLIAAQLPCAAKPGEEALHLVRYRIGAPPIEGSFSLAEVVGSLELRIIGPNAFQAGSQAAVRILVANRFDGEPVGRARVRVAFAGKDYEKTVFTGATAKDGACDLSFRVPDEPSGEASLIVAADRSGQKIELKQPVQIRRDAKILLTTDKPLYQPGQTIYVRALALSDAERRPVAKREALIEIQDGKGNKVFKRAAPTDAYGVAHAEFTLADEVNMGAYQISAAIGDSKAEKTVEVKRYALPKFKIKIDADRAWYLPKQTIAGSIQADYVFGKPTADADVTVEGLATIVGVEQFVAIRGKTDGAGRFAFEMKLPDRLTGTDIDHGNARVQVHATVVDLAGHKQEALRSFPVAKAALTIRTLPEAGRLVPGLPNRLFVMVSTPDGEPAAARLLVQPGKPPREDGWQKTAAAVATDRFGLAEFELAAPDPAGTTLTVRARDDHGNEVADVVNLRPERQPLALLLRADQPTYRVGDVIALTANLGRASTSTAYFDLVRENQTLLTASAPIKDGVATVAIPATDDLSGGLVASAYVFAPSGNLVRDTRALYVNPATDLKVEIRPDRNIYRPAERAAIDFHVADQAGHPVAAALGVTIVDEAVFALQDMQPGLEKIFFTLEKELMTPRYEVHEFDPKLIVLDAKGDLARRRAQRVMLAAVKPALSPAVDKSEAVDLRPEIRRALEKQGLADLQRLQKKYAKKQNADALDAELDPWFTPYRVYRDGEVIFRIDSAGPDRKFDTADDVSVTDPKYEVRRKKGMFLDGMVGAAGGMERFERPMAMAAPAAARNAVAEKDKSAASDVKEAAPAGAPGIRVREYFPETLYVNPSLIVGADGRGRIELPMADSITTWRIGAQAVSAAGWLGSASAPLRVFQDFFIDIDFPPTLTRGDIVSVPIALHNYLPQTQTVKLQIQAADWFELLDGGLTRSISLAPNEVKAEWLKLKAVRVGQRDLTVAAHGSKQSDAVKRTVLIEPDGKMFEDAVSDRLQNEKRLTVHFPGETVPGADKLFVKIHPGLLSQVVEGLDNIFRMPFGCFEQTSSTTYPNVMVLDYLKATRQLTPSLQMKAEGFINQGYQRLLTFEVPGGGFEWFGRAPAHVVLTAFGVMEFYDMSKVYNVDPSVIRRTQQWLASKQEADGSWRPNERVLDAVAAAFTKDVVRNTAYVAWALARTGDDGAAMKKGDAYLAAHLDEAKDAYTLALLANALVEGRGSAAAIDAVFAKLAALRRDEGEVSYWPAAEPTAMHSGGKSAEIETSALAALALLHAKREPQTINRVVNYLVRSKDALGTYYSTQATVWALHVLLGVARGGGGDIAGQARILVNGELAGEFAITAADSDVLRQVDASRFVREGDNEVRLSFAGNGEPAFQVVSRYYVPWDRVNQPPAGEAIAINVGYDKTSLAVDDVVSCTATIANHAPGDFGMVVVDIGVPPGFAPVAETLTKLVDGRQIGKFSTTARQVTFYLDKLAMNETTTLTFQLKAQNPVRAAAPESKAYEYYNPEVKAVAAPVEMIVQ